MKKIKHENWHGWKQENMKTDMDVWQPEELRTLCHSSGVSLPAVLHNYKCLSIPIWKKEILMGSTIGYVLFCHLLSIILKYFELFCFSCKQINLPSPSLSALANIFWIWRKLNKKDLLLQCLEVIELIRKIKNPFEMVWKWLVRSNTNPRPHIMLEATPCNFSKLIINAISSSVLARFIFLIAETQNK